MHRRKHLRGSRRRRRQRRALARCVALRDRRIPLERSPRESSLRSSQLSLQLLLEILSRPALHKHRVGSLARVVAQLLCLPQELVVDGGGGAHGAAWRRFA